MRVVIIGGSGHVGTYLVPRLVEAGHEVVAISSAASSSPISRMRPGARSSRSRSIAMPRRRPASFGRRIAACAPMR